MPATTLNYKHSTATTRPVGRAITSAVALVEALGGRNGMAPCPAHEDDKPSLAIADGRKGIVVRCHAGCSQSEVLAALRARGLALTGPTIARVTIPDRNRDDDPDPDRDKRRVVGAAMRWADLYNEAEAIEGTPADQYLLARGLKCQLPKDWRYWRGGMTPWWLRMPTKLLALTVPIRASATGRVQGYHVTRLREDGSGKAAVPTPRTMHGVAKGGVVMIGPEEGDVLAVAEGLETALSVHQAVGCRTWAALSAGNMGAITIPLTVREVIVAADNDQAGIKAAQALAERVARAGKVAKLAIPEHDGEDWNDVLTEDGENEVARALHRAEIIEAKPGLLAMSDAEFAMLDLPPPAMLLGPWLGQGEIAMIHAFRGTGKTYLALSIAYAVARGVGLLGWDTPAQHQVVYFDGEMPATKLQRRIRLFRKTYSNHPGCPVKIIADGLQRQQPDLGTVEGQRLIDEQIDRDTKLIVIDSISRFCRQGLENDSEPWRIVEAWAKAHRAAGRTVLFLHHTGKGGKQRGTSAREDIMDVVLKLEHPEGYDPEQGAVFQIEVEKGRELAGAGARSFVATMKIDETGIVWTQSTVAASNKERAVAMVREGKSQAAVARDLEVDRSTVSRWVAEAERQRRRDAA